MLADGHLAMDGLVERYHGLTALDADYLQLVVDETQQVGVVVGIKLDEEVVVTRRVVALNDLGHLAQLGHDTVGVGGVAKQNADKGTRAVAHALGVEKELRTLDDTHLLEFLNALMDGCAGDVALARHLEEGDAGIVCYQV